MSIVSLEQLSVRVDGLERELDELRSHLFSPEARDRVLAPIQPFNAQIAELSKRCFPNGVQFEADSDVETKEHFFVVTTYHPGTAEEMAAASIQWHRLMAAELNSISNFYRLSVRGT
jgi:hypothetical protein